MKYIIRLTIYAAVVFLTGCNSLSSEISDSFKTVEESLNNSNHNIIISIDRIYSSIDSSRDTHLNRVLQADSVYDATMTAFEYFDSLKNVLHTIDTTGEDMYVAENLFVATPIGKEIRKNMSAVYQFAYSSLSDKSKKADLDSIFNSVDEIFTRKDWEKSYFENNSTVAAMTSLSKFQNDCLNAASISLTDIKAEITP